ncbi:MAG: bifunctional diguanylate cyclase/phosphodiesterase [Nocardioidaceae bacterium]|nr:bifunctional diguanylate cyclase/phosphodiesterase [Nocardioidaceae bacterium]
MTAAIPRALSWAVIGVFPLVGALFVLGDGSALGTAVAAAVVLAAVAAACWGGRAHLDLPVLRWSLVGCAAGFVLSELTRVAVASGGLGGSRALAVLPLVPALAGYGLALLFIVVMVRRVASQAGLVLWIDAGLLAVGVTLVAWTTLVTPVLTDPARVQEAAFGVLYIGIDALIIGLVLQLSVRPVARVPAFWFMLGGFAAMTVGDVGRALEVAGRLDASPAAIDVWQLAAFVLLTATCLHPSVAELRTGAADHAVHANPARLVISYVALTVPTIVLLENRSASGLEHRLRTALYVVLVSAVFARMCLTAVHLARLQRTTRHRADHDELTGLLNRSATLATLQRRLDRTDGRTTHLLFVDVDHFKQVNDTWGHGTGDAVLRQAASRILRASGPGAVVGRVGGDEFVVGCHEDPLAVATRIRGAFAESFARPDGEPLAVTCSIGVASQGEGTGIDTLVADADVAMYSAKKADRNSIRQFSQQERHLADETAQLRQLLDGALERDELAVHLQPLVDVDGAIAGYEALLRWTVPGRGPVPPDVFVPIADGAGLMERLGAWVLREACAHLVPLRERHGPDLYVSVNLTARQLADTGLHDAVTSALRSADLPPTALWLELTESSMVRDTVATRENVAALRRIGVVFALDDFGTGFASLAHLHDIDCQVVKIDRSFVARLGEAGSAEAIIRAIIAMAHSLELSVVAEGVETRAQAERLRLLGVDYLQGYYFGRPTAWDVQAALPAPGRQIA